MCESVERMAAPQLSRWIGTAARVVGWILVAWAVFGAIYELAHVITTGASSSGGAGSYAWSLIAIEIIFALGVTFLLTRGRKQRKFVAAQRAEDERRTTTWTERDEALLQTFQTVGNYHRQRGDLVVTQPTVLALRYDDEVIIGAGAYEMIWWGRVGDGSWSTNGIVAVGTGAVGVGLIAGSLIANSVAKSQAQARAMADATVTWRPVDRGVVHVSNYGFFLTDGECGYRSFEWGHVVSAQMVDLATVEFSAQTNEGPQTWRITSDWAEAIFGLWALARNQQHPQWLDGSWYPADIMRTRLSYFGRVPIGAPDTLPVRISS